VGLAIMESALLISSSYEPIKVISWKRAIVLCLTQKVEVLEEYDRVIHSASLAMRLPAVMKLTRFVKSRQKQIRFSRRNLFVRDNYTCQYCHTVYPPYVLTFDHVIPRSKGGKTCWTNVVTSCRPCNWKKGNKSLHVSSFRLMKPPVEPVWLPPVEVVMRLEAAPVVWRSYLPPSVFNWEKGT